jgi:hypothetical protein
MYDTLLMEMLAKTRIEDMRWEAERDRLAAQAVGPGGAWRAMFARALSTFAGAVRSDHANEPKLANVRV